jgi:hypothetical protein
MGKAWIIKATRLKVRIDTSSGKIMPTRGMNTTMRAWVNIKASRHKTALSWTKTIWAMVRSMRKTRQSTRRKVRWKINKLIMIWVSSIVHMPLLYSLALKAKLTRVTHMATKHANVNFLTWVWSIFLHTSFGVEGWLGIGWVVGFGWFGWFFLFVIIGVRNKLESTLFTFILTSLKTNTQFVCGFGYTLLN